MAIADPVGLFGAIASGIRLDGDLVEPAKAWSSSDGIVCSGRGEGSEFVVGGSFMLRRRLRLRRTGVSASAWLSLVGCVSEGGRGESWVWNTYRLPRMLDR